MPTRQQLQTISKTRLKEVKALYRNRLYDGANYLSGYVIETALKARVCRILDGDYPETGAISRSFLTHDLDQLIKLAGLQKAFDSSGVNFKTNWSIVTNWSEVNRYMPIGTTSKVNVEDLLNALEDKNDGVLTWIRKRW
jgi:hypothetical protein